MGRSVLDYLFITNADQDHLSDLDGLMSSGISIRNIVRNSTIPAAALRRIKAAGGYDTADMQRYLNFETTHLSDFYEPFDLAMGGIQARLFYNNYPAFTDTNNLSCAIFIEADRNYNRPFRWTARALFDGQRGPPEMGSSTVGRRDRAVRDHLPPEFQWPTANTPLCARFLR